MKHNIRYNVDDLENQNFLMPKPVLRPEYGTVFEH